MGGWWWEIEMIIRPTKNPSLHVIIFHFDPLAIYLCPLSTSLCLSHVSSNKNNIMHTIKQVESPPSRTTRWNQKLRRRQSHHSILQRRSCQKRTRLPIQTQPHTSPNPQTGMATQLAYLHPRPCRFLQDI